MKTKIVSYEWDIEHFDEHGDIWDHHHSDTCPGIPEENDMRLVLVRDVEEFWDGVSQGTIDRQWAYVKDGRLPEFFEDSGQARGAKVPQKFHRELAKYARVG
jgi:hypothetical protein